MGILIAIDGVDASGKQTQTELLCERLQNIGKKIRKVSFPMYDSPSSILVKQYLAGDFGSKPSDVNAYAASMLFAADRFSTYRTDWGEDYKNGVIIIADRYVSSNMIHQAGKIADEEEKKRFLAWLDDLEFSKLELPRPDITFFLDMPAEFGQKLMQGRNNKITGGEQKDIHESDKSYLEASYKNALYVASQCGWERISCVEDGQVRDISQINDEMFSKIMEKMSI